MNKQLKYSLIALLVLSIGFAVYYFASKPMVAEHSEHQKELYTCSMHPEIIRDKPGKCPVCGMTLVKKVNDNKEFDENTIDIQLKATDKIIIGNYETTTPKDTSITSEIKLPGNIAYDPNSASNIAARVSGRIEKMYVNYKFQAVNKGQKLFDLYSPELLTEQQNFIYLITNDQSNTAIIKAAKSKLMLYGMTNYQINTIASTKNVNPIISIVSPTSGIISGTESMASNTPNPMQSNNTATELLTVKQGDYIKKNETVFKLLNTTKVWGVFDVLQGYNTHIYINQPIKIFTEASSDNFIEGKVNFIETQLNPSDKTNKVRVYLNNSQKYPIGLRLQGVLQTKPLKGLWISKTAVVSIGEKKIVFIKINNGFKAHEIQTGAEISEKIQVIKGITVKDKIAKNAAYLIDSESFIKTE